ncbi:drug-responsive transcription factor pdr3 [Turnera subulata]|uniref:Drug-responsive transcription factor pdr3 n=1 Tax=Turnera subulata TaxID=218843 RepID=A0A9Q0F2U0_9ROSI|nr:drug-responsive transcription factor pdr3 [Turnera subulata]
MYSSWAYSFAQVLIEVPYLLIQAIIYVSIAYPMIGYSACGYKIFWSFYGIFCTLLCFNYLGMLLVSVTPTIQLASILASASYTMLHLFAGFIVPKPHIPKGWLWLYYLCPTSWALNIMLTSQYGDINKEISVFGETNTVSAFLGDYLGFHQNFLGVTAAVLLIFPIFFASLFAYFIGRLNFQRR